MGLVYVPDFLRAREDRELLEASLPTPCPMRFQRRDRDGVRHVYVLHPEPRSPYVLAGKARSAWQHGILATKGLRYAFTVPTTRPRFRPAGDRGERAG